MDLTFEERPSESPYIETIWRSASERAGAFISMADDRSGLVLTRFRGRTEMTVRGPEARATLAHGHAGAVFLGIRFKAGVYLRDLPPRLLLDRRDVNLPAAASGSFWLGSSAWQYPSYENADTFVARLVRGGLLTGDPAIAEILQGHPVQMSSRTAERRFLQASGLTRGSLDQIERARFATWLLKQGVPILDVVTRAGYYDQPHLTRALRRFIGLTPAQIADETRPEALSFLYKTARPAEPIL